MLKKQSKQGAAGIQHDIGKLYDLKNDIGETQTISVEGSQPDDSMQDTFLHGLEQQPCGVQVVEWVGLVASSFQFFTHLAAVFA